MTKLEHDAQQLITTRIELSEIRILFDFVRTFSSVGDIGDDAEDTVPDASLPSAYN